MIKTETYKHQQKSIQYSTSQSCFQIQVNCFCEFLTSEEPEKSRKELAMFYITENILEI